MPAREPHWWYGSGSQWKAALLAPVGYLVGYAAAARLRRPPAYRSRLPVICVGNFTAGGSGKTPLSIFMAQLVANEKRDPWFLTRGYGGRLAGPLLVDPNIHSSADVGDEPLLLARRAPTVVSRDRGAGAQFIEANASRNAVIIMDDGLQNPTLAKGFSIAVVSGDRGLGNGRVIPAGPLRAPLAAQARLADAVIVTGQPTGQRTGLASDHNGDRYCALRDQLRALTNVPVIAATTHATADAAQFRGRRVVAYAGIANPARFFAMLEDIGAISVERRVFSDHHAFSESEARDLIDTARRASAELVTTEKDLARLSGAAGAQRELRNASAALIIESTIDGDDLAIVTKKIRGLLDAQDTSSSWALNSR